MAEKTADLYVTGGVWIADPSSAEMILENESGRITVERTDEDEVAVHWLLPGEDQATVTVYTNRMGAAALSGLLMMEAAKKGFDG